MKSFRTLALLTVVLCLLVLPFLVGNPAVSTIAVFTLLFAAAATGWNIFSGYTGYYSLGHAAYFGLGAYALAVMCQRWNVQGGYLPFLLVPVAGLFAGLLAVPLGWVALRARRYTFVVLTLAILFICRLLATNLFDITGGSAGMYLPLPPWNGDVYTFPFYYVSLALLLLVTLVSWWVRSSKYGLSLLAIRDDEERVRSLGVKTRPYKLAALVISAILVGMAGALVGYFVGIIYPASAFDPTFDITIIVMTFLGGVGTLAGPVLGAFLLEPIQQFITLQFGSAAAGLDLVIYGAFFLLVLLLVPEGIVPTLHKRWDSLRATRRNGNRGKPSQPITRDTQEQSIPSRRAEGGIKQ
jgi:branched-chain amino acid transport system permease protein